MRAQYETRLATLKTTNYKDGQFLIIILSKLQYKKRIDDHLNLRLSQAEISKIVCFLVIKYTTVGVIRKLIDSIVHNINFKFI